MKAKILGGALVVTALTAVSLAFMPTFEKSTLALNKSNNELVNCPGGYQTDFGWNISYDEIVELTSFEEGYKTLDGHEADLIACSAIISEATATKGQYYRQEDGKLEVKSLKFGTASAGSSLSLVLTKEIDAIGFYAEAYQHVKDADGTKTLTVNGIETAALGNTYNYDTCQRFFIEFEDSTNEVTIAATNVSNNRFYIYSIGFYSKNGFPDAAIPVNYTVSFDANGGTGSMTSVVVNEGSYTLPTSSTFTAPSGKEFDGWALSASGTKLSASIEINADVTLYALWKDSVTPVDPDPTGEWHDATMIKGTNGYDDFTVNEKSAIKVGTSSKGGDMSITVAAGSTKLELYVVAWKGVSNLSLNITGATTDPSSIDLNPHDNITGNGKSFTISNESDYKFEITLSNITTETTLTFTSSIGKRFVVWGARYYK